MGPRGSCRDNAAMQSFFPWIERKRIQRRIYGVRADARGGVFDCVEPRCNPLAAARLQSQPILDRALKAVRTKWLKAVCKRPGDSCFCKRSRIDAKQRPNFVSSIMHRSKSLAAASA